MSLPRGLLIDNQTRCVHWNSELDIVCFKFKCCQKFYSCHSCHDSLETHTTKRYSLTKDQKEPVVLCGACRNIMTFDQYQSKLACGSHLQCPSCRAPFNPNCKLHYSIYFDI
ncbi:LANO_0F16710g1_1 [Lachancea nothofagi CBS 11611]|uniref:LANO_0F16710g1_1 n=1 Tax=Lachancea nothofagi CBS 11611 TaxID=1266666 RepID=A0A1G4KCX8_9SACH|nr:LANO_0F16710g1_1 [Lachancea nothofagi CBS 11611]